MSNQQEETCIICGKHKTEGIRIFNEFICRQCEKEIVQTDVQDEKYPFFIHRLRRIWYKKNA